MSEFEDDEDDGAAASNCTDETKREFYRNALIAKIALDRKSVV